MMGNYLVIYDPALSQPISGLIGYLDHVGARQLLKNVYLIKCRWSLEQVYGHCLLHLDKQNGEKVLVVDLESLTDRVKLQGFSDDLERWLKCE